MSFQLQRVSNWNLKEHTAQTKQTSNIWSQAFHCKYWHVWHLIGFQTPPKVLSGNNFHCFFCGGGDSGQDWDRACAGPRLGSSGRSLGSRYVGQCTQGQDERWATDVRVGVSSWDDTNLYGWERRLRTLHSKVHKQIRGLHNIWACWDARCRRVDNIKLDFREAGHEGGILVVLSE